MRKIDKQINIIKSNLLCEQRYLERLDNSDNSRIKQLYSSYLDTFYSSSQIKDIVYHGTKAKEFDRGYFRVSDDGTFGPGVYFFKENSNTNNGSFGDTTIFAKILTRKPFDATNGGWGKLADELRNHPEYVASEPNYSLTRFISSYLRKGGYDSIIGNYAGNIIYTIMSQHMIRVLGDDDDISAFIKYIEENRENLDNKEIKIGVDELFESNPKLNNLKL